MDHILKIVYLTGESITVIPPLMGDGSDPMERAIFAVLGLLQPSRIKINVGNMTQPNEKNVSSAISFVFSPLRPTSGSLCTVSFTACQIR